MCSFVTTFHCARKIGLILVRKFHNLAHSSNIDENKYPKANKKCMPSDSQEMSGRRNSRCRPTSKMCKARHESDNTECCGVFDFVLSSKKRNLFKRGGHCVAGVGQWIVNL